MNSTTYITDVATQSEACPMQNMQGCPEPESLPGGGQS